MMNALAGMTSALACFAQLRFEEREGERSGVVRLRVVNVSPHLDSGPPLSKTMDSFASPCQIFSHGSTRQISDFGHARSIGPKNALVFSRLVRQTRRLQSEMVQKQIVFEKCIASAMGHF